MMIKQIRSNDGTGTLSYLLYNEKSNEAAIIDPNKEDVNKIAYMADELGVNVKYIIETHTHADHYTGAEHLKKIFDAEIVMHEQTKNKLDVLKNAAKFGIEDILNYNVKTRVDVFVNDGDILSIGEIEIKIIHTPGHTDNHIALLAEDALFTGDLLLIGQAGRSDLPGGNTSDQFDSLFNKVIELPEKTKIYPGHDYEENEFAYLKDELITNPFLQQRTKDEYINFVNDFFPPFAEVAAGNGKATLQCGTKRVTQPSEGVKSITPDILSRMMDDGGDLYLLDVREPFELFMGSVEGVVNIPVRELPKRLSELPEKTKTIVVICASGNRSFEAAHYLFKHGFTSVLNLEGGTFGWLQSKLAVERS